LKFKEVRDKNRAHGISVNSSIKTQLIILDLLNWKLSCSLPKSSSLPLVSLHEWIIKDIEIFYTSPSLLASWVIHRAEWGYIITLENQVSILSLLFPCDSFYVGDFHKSSTPNPLLCALVMMSMVVVMD
jgi:hypothetical protein